jgi:hypothetical protein
LDEKTLFRQINSAPGRVTAVMFPVGPVSPVSPVSPIAKPASDHWRQVNRNLIGSDK